MRLVVRIAALFASASVIGLLAAACGGASAPSPAPTATQKAASTTVPAPAPTATAAQSTAPSSPQPAKFRVQITDSGFAPNEINVNQGDQVEITFVWANQGNAQDEHVIVLDGYNLEWQKIDSSSKEATMKFTADKSGAFGFRCDIFCESHANLLRGQLNVKAR